jgi:hypothetical protein
MAEQGALPACSSSLSSTCSAEYVDYGDKCTAAGIARDNDDPSYMLKGMACCQAANPVGTNNDASNCACGADGAMSAFHETATACTEAGDYTRPLFSSN